MKIFKRFIKRFGMGEFNELNPCSCGRNAEYRRVGDTNNIGLCFVVNVVKLLCHLIRRVIQNMKQKKNEINGGIKYE